MIFFLAKVERKNKSLNWDLMDEYHEVNSGITHLEGSLDEWYDLNGKLKGLFDDYADRFEVGFGDLVTRLVGKIEQGKVRAKNILTRNEASARQIEDERACAKNLLQNKKGWMPNRENCWRNAKVVL